MHDQAAQLRDLVRRASRENDAPKGGAPQLVAISGSKGGVGTTTLALNVSVALAQQGRRVVLADLDLCRADVALLCGIEDRRNVSDVLAARRTADEVLQPGPAGIRVLAGAWPVQLRYERGRDRGRAPGQRTRQDGHAARYGYHRP